ncbi:MAG: hypothetical protein IPK13_02510 [Deltaproteobacteria bacterium]|nr:hypothetical protein [Deltaproteobacteria bacterium]
MSDLKAMRSAKSLKGEARRFLASSLALLLSWTAVIPAATSSAFAQQSTEDVRFFHHDAHGAILAVTNRDGQVVWRDSPRPFGDVDGSASASGHSKFLDRPLEPTGLYELGERFYDPRYGRFLSQDPASLLEVDVTKPDGFNRFAYGLNNPYRYNDATGRVPVETILDAIDIGVSLHDLWNEPSWSNGLFLAWSIGAVLLPYIPGAWVRRVAKAGKHVDTASDVTDAVRVGDHVADAARGTALEGANFAQKTFGSMFSRGGAFAGRSVDDVAAALRAGAMSPSEVPINYIVRDGNTLILNTRSAQALEAAGIPRSAWNAVNRTGQEVFENMLTGQLQRNGLTSAGAATVRRSGGM